MYMKDLEQKWIEVRSRLTDRVKDLIELFGLEYSKEVEDKVLSLLGVYHVFYDLNWKKSKHQLEQSFNKLPDKLKNKIEDEEVI